MIILAPEVKQRGLAHVQKLRVELQAVLDSKNGDREVGRLGSYSKVSFLTPKAKRPALGRLS